MRSSSFFTLFLTGFLPLSSGTPSSPATKDVASAFVRDLVRETRNLKDTVKPASCQQKPSRIVDLGYAKYEGYNNAASGLNIWKGIRFAAPPTDALRWQPPQPPASTNQTIPATEFSEKCPQVLLAGIGFPYTPDVDDEDCLFLNVWAPEGAKDLPVMVWIHGGGYGFGDGRQDMSEILAANDNGFIVVSIQYRLGAFGFLSSADVKARGIVNAGLLDQAAALSWVQGHICQFGGDRNRVTITGESAGAGSVMYHALAGEGKLGSLFFNNGIAASPYLPFHYDHDADFPTSRYESFAKKAGCDSAVDVLECLRGKDSETLKVANYDTTQEQTYGLWAFYPVSDGAYLKGLPTKQLSEKRVNGERLLVGNNANEGPQFTPPSIATDTALVSWLKSSLPNLSDAQIDEVLAANPSTSHANDTRFETNGLTGLTALDVSQSGTGPQQRANAPTSNRTPQNILAEQTFVCPSYWLADAFSAKAAWHYQYSVPFAWHTADVRAYFGPATPGQGPDLVRAFRRIWGNFVTTGDPSIDTGAWPRWDQAAPQQLNLNQTGGEPIATPMQWGVVVTEFAGEGLQNDFSIVPADSWEGERGARCGFWQGLAPSIPA
ncbi:acetylcholinesterase [Colletotrichum sojae]|uniref:Carboxylic ester hydrolase n=1 Tax=Colletotrichum sojae TaxID=2175907 RepID=A0A8H6MKQ9_9PEZI|nr:acetylcholinesterase [Colletotrichum sojae]